MAFRFPLPRIARDGSLALLWRLIKETGREFTGRYALAIFFSILVAASLSLTAWLMKDVVNGVFVGKQPVMLFVLAGSILTLSIIRGVGLYGSAVIMSQIGNAIVARTQRRLVEHSLNLGVDFHAQMSTADLITRMTHNASAARDVLNNVMLTFGRDLLTLIGLVTVMFFQSPVMSIFALIGGPIAIWVITKFVKRIRDVVRSLVLSVSMVTSDIQETGRGIRIIKAFNLEALMRKRLDASIDLVRQRTDKIARVSARSSPLMEILAGFAISGIILWSGYQIIYYGAEPGRYLSFLVALLLAYEPAKRLARSQIIIEGSLVGVRMMYEVLDTKPTMDVNVDGPDLEVSRGEVVFDRVDFAYRAEAPLFRGLNFIARAGEMTALVGPSGSGKSTMIALIERFFDVSAGRILIDGQDISKVKVRSLREHLALVSQDTVLFRNTIRENIRYGRLDATNAEVEQAARDAMAHDFILATAEGYDTIIGGDATELSGGQRQRIAIARAMLRNAQIVLLDEATSSLDSQSEYLVQLAFDRLTRGRTTIVIAHRLSTVLHADKIAVLVSGQIVEEGRHDELLKLDSHYARLYHLQFESRNGSVGDEAEAPPTAPAT